MEVKIENPLELLLEITYLNGATLGKELPEMININKLLKDLRESIK